MFYVFLCKLQLKLKTTLIIRIKVKSRFVILIAIIKSIFPFCFCPGYCRKTHPLGLSNQVTAGVPDGSIKASSELYATFGPNNARLRNSEYWCAKRKSNETLSVDFGQLVIISGVATQGTEKGKTTKYRISYKKSYDDRTWYGYPNNASLAVRFGMFDHFPFFSIFLNFLTWSICNENLKKSTSRNS